MGTTTAIHERWRQNATNNNSTCTRELPPWDLAAHSLIYIYCYLYLRAGIGMKDRNLVLAKRRGTYKYKSQRVRTLRFLFIYLFIYRGCEYAVVNAKQVSVPRSCGRLHHPALRGFICSHPLAYSLRLRGPLVPLLAPHSWCCCHSQTQYFLSRKRVDVREKPTWSRLLLR